MGEGGEADSFEALLGALAHAPDLPLTPEPRADLAPGTRIGRYLVRELLGRGAMGTVYRARDETLGRDVAIKLIHADPAGAGVDRFRREVVALAAVSHENVVAVHDAGVDGSTPYFVLELVDGQTLRARLRARPFGPTEALRLARDLARGLGAAHAVGVIHRDLKPENVLLDRQGTAKIVDFGLARLVERETDGPADRTESGLLLGTADYMAPEQVRGERVDHRADLFALGAVLYEALTGRRAFAAPSRAEVITAVLRDQPPTDAALLSDPSTRRLLGVAFRCLEKSPDRRFGSAAELVNALETDSAPQSDAASVDAVGAARERHGAPVIPETRYATSSGVHIAYQVVSPPGLPTLLAAPPFISNIEVIWESPPERQWISALASFSHFIHYDRRGVGVSDPIAPECTLDERVEDLRAVLDAERVHRSFLLGVSEGGPVAIAFAVKYPERTRGLVLMGSFARMVRGDKYDHGLPREGYQKTIDRWVATWGTPQSLSLPMFTASRAGDPDFVRWGNRYERQCASPGTVRRLLEMHFDTDVRALLPRVACPVLVLHRRQDPAIAVEHGRYLGSEIPGARYLELEGVDHAPWHGDPEAALAATRGFVTEVAAREGGGAPTPPGAGGRSAPEG